MKRALTTTNPAQIANLNDVMKQAGQAANQEALRRDVNGLLKILHGGVKEAPWLFQHRE